MEDKRLIITTFSNNTAAREEENSRTSIGSLSSQDVTKDDDTNSSLSEHPGGREDETKIVEDAAIVEAASRAAEKVRPKADSIALESSLSIADDKKEEHGNITSKKTVLGVLASIKKTTSKAKRSSTRGETITDSVDLVPSNSVDLECGAMVSSQQEQTSNLRLATGVIAETTKGIVDEEASECFLVRPNSNLSSDDDLLGRQLSNWCCAICLENYKEGGTIVWSPINSCPHMYHQDCIVDFILSNQEVNDHEKVSCLTCRGCFLELPAGFYHNL